LDRSTIVEILLNSGAWPFIKQRPYGILADPDIIPKSIYVSSCCTAPLGVDFEFLLKNDKDSFQLGIDVLNNLVKKPINLSIDASFSGFLEKIKGVNILLINGPHPAGNVSVQMQKHLPINMGEKVWEVRPEDVANIGKLFSSGEYSAQRTIAVAGSSVVQPQYIKTQIGAKISSLISLTGVDDSSQNRYINGDVLSGISESEHGYIDFYNNLLTIIPEGNHYRMFGWLPFMDNKIPSLSKTSLSWLFGKKGYEVDTNMNGEERAFVVTGEMEKVFPMDIYPMQLLKACMAEDIEKMEALGIYEVIPEDFGLIDYANTSKIEAQEIIRSGIELMIKEVG
jgi:Na+-transporting NADH:ubiquinone oxidoreductase subunit A